jgi:hypothetical protein
MRAFENKVQRRILGTRREKVTGVRKRLQSEELRYLYV